MKTNEKGEPFEDPGPPVGETAAEMMGSMNRVMRYIRDQRREYIETTKGLHGGPCFKENFQGNWSNVRYDRYVAAAQDRYDWILYDQRADHLVDDAIQPCPSGTLGCKHALVKGVAEIATKLNAAGFHYKAHNRSPRRLDHGWCPPRTLRTSRRTRSTP
jgi:hypothetical protein